MVAYSELDEVADSLNFDTDRRFAVLEGVSQVIVQDAGEVCWIDDRDQLGRTSLFEGSTEDASPVTDLIVGLRERGLDVTRPILAVLGAQ